MSLRYAMPKPITSQQLLAVLGTQTVPVLQSLEDLNDAVNNKANEVHQGIAPLTGYGFIISCSHETVGAFHVEIEKGRLFLIPYEVDFTCYEVKEEEDPTGKTFFLHLSPLRRH